MSMDIAGSLRRHYSTFLAVLVTGVILITLGGGTSPYTTIWLNCVLGVASLVSAYALAPAPPSTGKL
ncbi:hypothetical protein [Streptomyces sp. YS-3]|uniref:hypothetical protein n=1 Tax=Streptomyces sp. YS-3 TaxID=3381352 RepID=UPI003862B72B